jgi:hypothetical protein
MFLSEQDILAAIGQMHAKFGATEKDRFERGVRQAALLWTEKDGTSVEFVKFCTTHFMGGKERDDLFARFEDNMEALTGNFGAMSLQLRKQLDEDIGPLLPADMLFAGFDPASHLSEDMFANKLAFVALLNFPAPTLEETMKNGVTWSRRQWAEARLGQAFAHRVPADVRQKVVTAYTEADGYVTDYNVQMDHVVGKDGQPLFRQGLKLISHWGLRDELKAQYVDVKKNLPAQEVIQAIMERIVTQEIPSSVINSDKSFWEPMANAVDGKPSPREPDTRFERLLSVFHAHLGEDPYYPNEPSHMDRRFKMDREIPEERVQALLESVLKAPVGKSIASKIQKRLARPLKPFDIWYDGFKSRSTIPESELDRIVKEKYPNLEAFQKEIPNILQKLGFEKATAEFLGASIELNPARGSGHAWGPQMRTAKAHLRTKVPAGGMNYKGFNIAMHELGHNVEQVFSMMRVDHTLLAGVPNTAFTEGFAFVFQARDLDVLGLSKPDPRSDAQNTLDSFWATREIAGVGLVDMKVWRWMYAHPRATAAELRQAVVESAKEIWNQYYAPLVGVKDSPILAIYSHMINNGLYLPDYPMGHIIAFQVEDYFKSHPLGKEMERLCVLGRIAPDLWMRQAVGDPISVGPFLKAAEKAVKSVE